MGERTSYQVGTPCWADAQATDLDAAAAFYCELFGWTAIDQGAEAGHYTMFQLDGRDVAGVGPLSAEGMPPVWTTYLATDDVDAAAKVAAAAGGTVLAEPFDVLTSGRMAVIMDPTGAVFGAWQAKDHIGARQVNDPNTMCWNELATRDPDTALAFYSEVFGYAVNPVEMGSPEGGPFTYYELQVEGSTVAGCMPMDDSWGDIPPHWLVYFAVADTDAVCAKVERLGGSVPVAPTDIPPGRFAVVTDPGGAHFAVLKLEVEAPA